MDRLFRNILADMTGNTHRTEFCIDKLYAPEAAPDGSGLVEFRALEMPPHARMAAAQMLLMRAARGGVLAARRTSGGWCIGARACTTISCCRISSRRISATCWRSWPRCGFGLDRAWFEPHFEFRFPRIGEIALRGATLELRHALEPWHVLGEEAALGGTARYVDSSVERVQARVDGWVDERYVLACNGRAVPLTPTDRVGEYVGGVRFKAWNPPSVAASRRSRRRRR